jgi:hypothetical protein
MQLTGEQRDLQSAVEKLIFNGCNYNIDVLAGLYDPDLRIIIVSPDDEAIAFDYQDNLNFFIGRREAGAAPLDTSAKFKHIEVAGDTGYVIVVREMQLAEKPRRYVFSLSLRRSVNGWKVFRETAVVTSVSGES